MFDINNTIFVLTYALYFIVFFAPFFESYYLENLSIKFVVDYVKAKLKSLRNAYTKAKKPQSSGSTRKSLSKRSTWILDKLQFLEPYIATRTSTSSLDLVSIFNNVSCKDVLMAGSCLISLEWGEFGIFCNLDSNEQMLHACTLL